MSKSIISEGRTSTEAIEKGLKQLKVTRNQVDIKILEEKKKSFFNILDPHTVKVELTVKENEKIEEKRPEKIEKKEKKSTDLNELEDSKKEIEEFLNKFLKQVSENITYKIDINDDTIQVVLEGEDSTKLIGYRGEALNSIQVILSTIANKNKDSGIKVILDIGTYKEARKKTLEELAVKIEKTVTRTGKSITLEPMTAYERKIIHTKLQNSDRVETKSIGEEPRRKIVVSLKRK